MHVDGGAREGRGRGREREGGERGRGERDGEGEVRMMRAVSAASECILGLQMFPETRLLQFHHNWTMPVRNPSITQAQANKKTLSLLGTSLPDQT